MFQNIFPGLSPPWGFTLGKGLSKTIAFWVWPQNVHQHLILEVALIGTTADSVYLSSFWYPAPQSSL